MAKPVTITNLQGKTQDITPGKGYPATSPSGKRGYIVYNDKGEGKFTAYPTQPSAKPKPVTITNLQGKTQDITPGKGYPATSPSGKRGYIVYDNKGAGKFTAYPDKPASPTPSPTPSGGSSADTPTTPKPAPTAPKPASTAPKSSPVADYMKAAAAARKSGDPAQMAKVRDMGMEIWKKSNTKLATAAAERERIRGTAQTDNPLMKDMRSSLPVTPTVQAPAVKDLKYGQQSLSQNKFAGRSPEPAKPVPAPDSKVTISTDKQMGKTSDALSKNPIKKEAYDIVLDYLLSEGHVDTISEANYVMMQMSADHIQDIVEAERVLAQRTINGVTVPGYVSVNKTREGGFLGFGGKVVSKPVPGSFTQRNISTRDAARYNQAIDQKFGTGSNQNAMPALRVQTRAQNQGNSGYMRVPNPNAVRNTGAANRPTPQRAGDQNRALDILRPNVPIDTRKPAPAATKPATSKPTQISPVFQRPVQPGMSPIFQRPAQSNLPPLVRNTAEPVKSGRRVTDAEFNRLYPWAADKSSTPKPAAAPGTTSRPASTAPATSKPKPKPPTIQSKNVTATGASYERRTPTSAELAAAKAAGGGEAGVKAAVDVAKTNKVASTSPTPDLKPEAPKKRESLASQVRELQAMRKAAEERNK